MKQIRTSIVFGIVLGFWACMSAAASETAVDYGKSADSVRELLRQLVEADTSNPPGNEERAAAIGAKRLKDAGVSADITEFAAGRKNLVARLKGTGDRKPLLLLAHIDVVGAKGQSWSTDPHKMIEREGFLIGRGVSDDLGMAAVEMEVFLLLKRANVTLDRDVILAWTGDEESGGQGILYLLKHKPESISAGLVLNEGGEISLDDKGKVNLVNIQAAEKTYQDFELIAKGPTGHSSVPLKENAIYRLTRALERFSHFREPARLIPVTREYYRARAASEPPRVAAAMKTVSEAKGSLPAGALKVLEEDPIHAANLRTTCVATVIQGGTRVNALPSEARANINCRILPDESVEDIRKQLVKVIADSAIEVKALEDFSRAEASPVQGEGIDAIKKTAGEMWPGVPVLVSLSRGATDSRFLRAAGIPAYGIDPIALTEADGRRAHGIDERIPVSSLRPAIEFFHRLVLNLAQKRAS
ncbi:MAG TPA: M20/M25/M40 family metallo-hydrolase [Bdellovibrionota bacterium]|nr:M20/M25/M40 family metallo-hydrolase [Bdellovibrionota bacterium]